MLCHFKTHLLILENIKNICYEFLSLLHAAKYNSDLGRKQGMVLQNSATEHSQFNFKTFSSVWQYQQIGENKVINYLIYLDINFVRKNSWGWLTSSGLGDTLDTLGPEIKFKLTPSWMLTPWWFHKATYCKHWINSKAFNSKTNTISD